MINKILPSFTEDKDLTRQTSHTILIDESVQGNISNTFDVDYFNVAVVSGQKYSIALIGTGTNPIRDPVLEIFRSDGSFISSNNDIQSGFDTRLWSQLTFTADYSGLLLINARSYGFDPGGQYGLSVSSGSKSYFDFLMGAGSLNSIDNIWGEAGGFGTTVTYGFRDSQPSYNNSRQTLSTFSKLSNAQIDAVRACLTLWSDVCNIKFVEINPGGFSNNATLLFGNYRDPNDGAGAFAYYPGSAAFNSQDGDVWLNISGGVSTTLINPGSYSFNTILHEIGHAIGLSHPGLYNAGPGVSNINYETYAKFVQDTGQYTVMSYFDNSAGGLASGRNDSNVTPMMFDILAMQNIYGVNMQTRTSDTVYGFGSNAGSIYDFTSNSSPQLCIWDAGGTDTLNCSGYSQNQLINLEDGSFSNIGSGVANISIALNVVMENAIGGSGNDRLIGNFVRNQLRGNAGDDYLDGGAGIDTSIYQGVYSGYNLSATTSSATVRDKTANRDGTDTLLNIERLKFSDVSIALDVQSGQNAGTAWRMYKAALNREPDFKGLGDWINVLDKGSDKISVLAAGFTGSAEFQARYGTLSTTSFVNLLYKNVLNRNPTTSEAQDWINAIDIRGASRELVLYGFSESTENINYSLTLIGNGARYIENIG